MEETTHSLTTRLLARVRLAQPKISDEAIVRLYVGHVPPEAYAGSCIFHGKKGCTLGRSMRANICNTFFCRDLGVYIRKRATPKPTVVIAGGGGKVAGSAASHFPSERLIRNTVVR